MRNPRNEPLVESDRPLSREREGSERRCVLTGRVAGRDELVRLAVSPDGDVLPDALAKAPGRGAWIGVPRGELDDAFASGKLKVALSRAFKTGALVIPADLPERVESALLRALLDRLGLEMRAGKLILGSDRIANELRLGRAAALYHAADAGEDGSRKLDQAFRVGADAEGTDLAGLRLPLDRAALSVALGRDNVVHLALADRASAGRVAIPLRRLLNFLGTERPPDAGANRAA
ncbi:MAG: DUF448 domain-containing protein [Altererythrobacter sp.]|nr:DUF448 domain-containing protein [Altererythrobacter sp.]OJU60350.1 MAG: nucleic-acid-binding protein [Altererythrobacter sp. 66-12]